MFRRLWGGPSKEIFRGEYMGKWLLGALLLCGSMHAAVPQFRWPIHKDKFWISSYFGSKERGRMHTGLDMAAMKGTIVRAAAGGFVEAAKDSGVGLTSP